MSNAGVSVRPKQAWGVNQLFVLGVSLGSRNHEGGALHSIVRKINQGSFTAGVIDLSDTLNRYHHMADGLSEEGAFKRTREEGDLWLKNNLPILKQIDIPITIHRWDEWLNHPNYPAMRSRFQRLYASSGALRDAIETDIENYYQRIGGIDYLTEEKRRLSRAYYLEELSAHALLYQRYAATNLYPGKQLNCFRTINQGLVNGAPDSLKHLNYARLVLHQIQQTSQSSISLSCC